MSHGNVATHLKFGWIFSDSVITNFLLILTVRNSLKRLQKKCANFRATLYVHEKVFSAAEFMSAEKLSCAPTNWWSTSALGGLRTAGGGGAPHIFHGRRRRGFMVGGGGVGGVRPDERAVKQRTR